MRGYPYLNCGAKGDIVLYDGVYIVVYLYIWLLQRMFKWLINISKGFILIYLDIRMFYILSSI